MKAALSDVPERQLDLPPNIIEKTIDSNSGLLSEGGGRKEYFYRLVPSLNVLTLRK